MTGKICFGITLYNNAAYIREAMDSLLNQTYKDFYIVAVDDCSTDETEAIMKEYVSKDNRVSYFRNPERKGMIYTWREVFIKANTLYQPQYFAWASDHDKWHPEWLENHINVFNDFPDAAVVYPETVYISNDGETLPIEFIPFDNTSESELERFFNVCTKVFQAGNAIYGLFKTSALIKAGIFRNVVMPDRLLLTEISLYGSIRLISKQLWWRRVNTQADSVKATVEAQKNKLFSVKNIPVMANFPYLWHAMSLAQSLVIDGLDNECNDIEYKEMLVFLFFKSHLDEITEEFTDLHKTLVEKFEKGILIGEEGKTNDELLLWMRKMIQHVSVKKDSLLEKYKKNEEDSRNRLALIVKMRKRWDDFEKRPIRGAAKVLFKKLKRFLTSKNSNQKTDD